MGNWMKSDTQAAGAQCPWSSAFTLIEIMIVVAIMGLTLSMGVPSFVRAVRRQGMRKAQNELLKACRDARAEAVMKNHSVDLVFHPTDGTFEVPGVDAQAQFPKDVSIDILGVNFIQYEQADMARVRFYPNGTSDEFTIVLQSPNEALKISLDTVTALSVVERIR